MSVEEWLGSLRSNSTKRVYSAGLNDFARSVLGDGDFDKTIAQYLIKIQNGHDAFKDLLTYATSLNNTKTPPTTANAYMAGVKRFLEFAVDYDLSRGQSRRIRNRLPKGKRPRTIEEDLTRERLRKILTHCDTKGKALFLFLVSSGIRVGEALQLELDDIDLKIQPVKVIVRGEYAKTGDPYYSFISKEARESLTEWMKERGQYLLSSAKRGKGLSKFKNDGRGVKSVEDKRLFPFSVWTASQMWNNALKKAGLENHDKGTNRRTLHTHMLRKYFNSQLKIVVPNEIVEALLGHEQGLSVAYRRYTEKQIREWYLKGEPHLYVFVPQEIGKIQTHFDTELQDLKDKISDLLYQNQKLLIERDEFRSKVENLSNTVDGLSDKFEQKVLEIERQFNERLNDFFADQEAQMSDAKEEVKLPLVSKEEIPGARQKLSEQKPKPKKELGWHELIYGTEKEKGNA